MKVCYFLTKDPFSFKKYGEQFLEAYKAVVEAIESKPQENWRFSFDSEYRIQLDGYYPHWMHSVSAEKMGEIYVHPTKPQ